MANQIKCPTCGKNNPAGQSFCQYCKSPLTPSESIMPGQAPTRKSTADLEPVLPDWLKDARASAQQSSQEEPPEPVKTPQTPAVPPPSAFSSGNLLAGLQSQSEEEEEEIPDWLANITGEASKPKKPKSESSDVRWVDLGGTKSSKPEPKPEEPSWTPPAGGSDELTNWLEADEPQQQAPQPSQPFSFQTPPVSTSLSGTTPDWLHSMVTDDGAGFRDAESTADETITSDTPDWLKSLDTEDNAAFMPGAQPASSDTPDWLKELDAGSTSFIPDAQPPSSDTPDWLKGLDAQGATFTPRAQSDSPETPDWLKGLDAGFAAPSETSDWLSDVGSAATAPQPDAQPATSDIPDWLKGLDAGTTAPSETPDWLKAVGEEAVAPPSDVQPAPSEAPDWLKAMGAEATPSAETPDWFKTMGEETAAPQPAPSETPDWLKDMGAEATPSAETPDWLKTMGEEAVTSTPSAPTSSAGQEPDWLQGFQAVEEEKPAVTEKPTSPVQPPAEEEELPSWLKASAPKSSIFAETPEQPQVPTPPSGTPDRLDSFKSIGEAATQPPSPLPGAEPIPDTDSLFTEMPDWLTVVDETAPPESVPAPITNADAIAPGELPSWVQAMRPVDAGISQAAAALSTDKTLETRGALAGLQGVLPAAPGYAPTSKPKAYLIKLKASEEQLSHAALLEQILSAEASPVHIGSFSALGTSRALRWTLVFLFFVILPVVLYLRTTFFALPDSVYVPLEVGGALTAIQAIPQDAPVLAIFDYEPARAGEVESVAVPVFDQLILRRSRLTFISTTETGAILAERLISSGYLSGHNYQSGNQYVNLGYLPGERMGIRAFAESPTDTTPYALAQTSLFDFAPVSAWSTPPLTGVTSLSQFAALVLITDDADSARAWIEQTMSARGTTPVPFVVISSAQAAPMLQPYYASGQISGLVSGLHGGALFEQYNNQKPGTARTYWDAYSIGMLLAMALILGGGLISLALGLRDRATAREAK